MWLLYVFSGEGDRTPSFVQQSVLDQGPSIIEMATAASDEEVPVNLCIIFEKFKVTLADLLEVISKNSCAHNNQKKYTFKKCMHIIIKFC